MHYCLHHRRLFRVLAFLYRVEKLGELGLNRRLYLLGHRLRDLTRGTTPAATAVTTASYWPREQGCLNGRTIQQGRLLGALGMFAPIFLYLAPLAFAVAREKFITFPWLALTTAC